ncbi:hypothetical protein ACIBEF_29240 [Micromonospora sp. NPDC050795]|uniref:hypothetical protein n=1 Tax=Micromonospora sp. NPDC050795 TaxID=3364282 RepID=UPI0037B9242E
MSGYLSPRLRRLIAKADELYPDDEHQADEVNGDQADDDEPATPEHLSGGMDPHDTGGTFGPDQWAYHRAIGANRPRSRY